MSFRYHQQPRQHRYTGDDENDEDDDDDDDDINSLAYRQTQAKLTCLVRRRAAMFLITLYCILGMYFGMRNVATFQAKLLQDEDMAMTSMAPSEASTTTVMMNHTNNSNENETTKMTATNNTDEVDVVDDKEDYLSWKAIEAWGRQHARVWSPLQTLSSPLAWCTKDSYGRFRNNSPSNKSNYYMFDRPTGLIYVKMPKAASSTLAGMVHRLALRVGQRLQQQQQNDNLTITSVSSKQKKTSAVACAFRNQHIKQVGRWYGNRNRSASMLWSSIRHPAARALSRVLFDMSFRKIPTITESTVMSLLQSMRNTQYGATSKGQGGFQLQYTSLTPIPQDVWYNASRPNLVTCPSCVQEHVRNVLQDYDVWMITERMEESLVLFSLLLQVSVGDILVFSTNQGGKYYYLPEQERRQRRPSLKQKQQQQQQTSNTTAKHSFLKSPNCLPLKKSFTTPAIAKYLKSRTWRAQNYGDHLLYAAIHASLDLTIQLVIGPERFQQALQQYRQLYSAVTKACRNQTIFPCSEHGQDQYEQSKSNCYHNDEGCGYPCIDRFLQQQQQQKQ